MVNLLKKSQWWLKELGFYSALPDIEQIACQPTMERNID